MNDIEFITRTDNSADIYIASFKDVESVKDTVKKFTKENHHIVFVLNVDLEAEKFENIEEFLKLNTSKYFINKNLEQTIDEVVDTSREWETVIFCGDDTEKIKDLILKKMKPYEKSLKELLNETGLFAENIKDDRIINFISSDSNMIIPNTVFVGIKGFVQNGAKYCYDAIKKGATALVIDSEYIFDETTKNIIDKKNIVVVKSNNTRLDFSKLVHNFYNSIQPETVVSVTGTSGKSSVADFTRQIWGLLKYKAVSIGTTGIAVENVYSEKRLLHFPSSHTTPTNGEVYKCLRYFADKGVTKAMVEVSSHGLDQYRIEGVKIKTAGFTNLGTDHLSYYGSYDLYLKSKAKLFNEYLDEKGVAVLNADVPEYEYLKNICDDRGIKIIDYGKFAKDLKIISQKLHLSGQNVTVEIFGKKYELDLQVSMSYQLYNLLCAVGIVFANEKRENFEKIISVLSQVKNVTGRMEYMGKTKKGSFVYVDFAYKGDALTKTLSDLREIIGKGKKIINVFGTCGNCYEWKTRRYELGTASYKYADISILTDDSPRNEDPKKIRNEVKIHCPNAIEIDTGRKDAIVKAMELGGDGDVILVAGKGHEDYYTIGDKNIPYTDQETIKELLNNGL